MSNTPGTAPKPVQPAAVEPPPILVDLTGADETDRLVTLYQAYPQAKADADAAAATLKAITDGIKLELTTRAPEGTAKFELKGAGGKALRLTWQVTRRFNTKRFTAEHPDVYEAYRESAGSWKLEPIRGGAE